MKMKIPQKNQFAEFFLFATLFLKNPTLTGLKKHKQTLFA